MEAFSRWNRAFEAHLDRQGKNISSKKLRRLDVAAIIKTGFGILLPLKTNFGGEPSVENENIVFNTVLLECLIAGIIVWGAYQASLTSELSIIKLKLPFIDLETLYESDYK